MDIRRLLICLAILVGIVGVTACSQKTADQTGKTDAVQGKDGNIVSGSGVVSRQGAEGWIDDAVKFWENQ